MSKADPINVSTPAGGSNPRLGDDYMRQSKRAIVELMEVNHYMGSPTDNAYDEDDAGKHRLVTFRENQSVKPTLGASDTGILYTKAGEIYYEDASGNEIQLSSAGKLRFASLDNIANNTYLKAIDEAGTGTVDLIKAGRNEADDDDVAVLSDETRLATNAAPTEDTQISNKKYVDDQILAAFVPAAVIAGTGSVTLKNGLIVKFGSAAVGETDNEHTVTFGTPFPHDVFSIQITGHESKPVMIKSGAGTYSVNGFTSWSDTDGQSYFWLAIGY